MNCRLNWCLVSRMARPVSLLIFVVLVLFAQRLSAAAPRRMFIGNRMNGLDSVIATSTVATNTHKKAVLFSAFRDRTWVTGEGCVTRILEDDVNPPCHQRFIVADASGQTLLVVNSIDGWPRLAGVKVGDRVAFRGEFIDAPGGALVHWTHPDRSRRRTGGWLKIVSGASVRPVDEVRPLAPPKETEGKDAEQSSVCKEYFAGTGPIRERIAAPVNRDWPETGYWLSTNSNKRHNRHCENYRKTRGYPCTKTDGSPCGKCGG